MNKTLANSISVLTIIFLTYLSGYVAEGFFEILGYTSPEIESFFATVHPAMRWYGAGLTIIYAILILVEKELSVQEKVMWCIGLFLLYVIAMVFFWHKFILNSKYSEPRSA